ncbi:MAG: molybdenum ABC transporter ATP-binding protein [Rhodocyclaceae bacterium]|nr:molybdenum ABC transporter ATP-binding protein [Rhodocyclaceae bacterium]MDZ4213200.1 molybdenum ABC transporter ATP-binding protein [Rhodocyclaceae bacterium]
MIEARFKLDYPGFTLDVDLSLPSSGVTALFGHSGSGKTTLLRAIAGLERVPGGRLMFDGEVWQDENVFLPTHQRPLGYVFQEASLFAHLTVRGNLDYGTKRRPTNADFSNIIDMLGIGALLDRKPDRLSGGERQRVAIARALLTQPRLLLMDEPLAALDLARKREILPYLEQLHETLKIPVLYVSHAPDEVARLADHIVALDAGRVVAAGPLAETLARADLPIRLGEDAGVVLDATVAEIDHTWHLARVEFPGGSLWVRDEGHPVGKRLRVRVLARDVSLARAEPSGTSILNHFRVTVRELADDAHPTLLLARVEAGERSLLARLTRRSAAALELAPGVDVWAQVKAVAVLG